MRLLRAATFIFPAVTVCVLFSQQSRSSDPYSIGANLSSHPGCGIFVLAVEPGSPADRAGIKGGDRIGAIEGRSITEIREAVKLLAGEGERVLRLELTRGDRSFALNVQRERRSEIYRRIGLKVVSGIIVPIDTSDAEIANMQAFDGNRLVGRAFTLSHYPLGSSTYYGGFELFVLKDPPQVMVGGIESGPASRAGLHWGDVLVSVDGTNIAGISSSELEALLSSEQPKTLTVEVERLGAHKGFSFALDRADEIARQNGKRYLDGRILPSWVTSHDSGCFK